MDLKKRIIAVSLAVEQGLKFFFSRSQGQCHQAFFGFGDNLFIALHLAQFNQFDRVRQVLLDRFMRGHRINQNLPLTH